MRGNQIYFICLISFYTQIDERVEQPFSGLFSSPYVYFQLFNCIFHVEDLSSQNQEDRNNMILDSFKCLRPWPVISHCYHPLRVAFVSIKTAYGIGVLGCRAVFLILPVVAGTGEMSENRFPCQKLWRSSSVCLVWFRTTTCSARSLCVPHFSFKRSKSWQNRENLPLSLSYLSNFHTVKLGKWCFYCMGEWA